MISAQSTLDDVIAEYIATANYSVNRDAALAARFTTACRILLVLLPRRASLGGAEEYEINTAHVADELNRAEAWLARVNPRRVSPIVKFDFSRFRD